MMMSLLLPIALSAAACDRRDTQPRQASETTDTVILDPAVGDRAAIDPLPPPATSPCAGLSGQAEAECRERERARRADQTPRPAPGL